MKVYLVRHGQTTFNAKGINQPPNAKLSDIGKKQAYDLAERLVHVPITKIITSTHTRALQTAEIINNKIHKPLEKSDLLVEHRRPSEVENESHQSYEVKKINRKINDNFSDPVWHYSDEENYYDVLDRAMQALDFLQNHKDRDSLLVISHSAFIKTLLGVMIFGGDFAPSMGKVFGEALKSHNTGITMTEYRDGMWKLLTWNDYAHLGE